MKAIPTETLTRIGTVLGVALVILALVFMLAFGPLGVGRSGPINFDGFYWYAAGVCWLEGTNPYVLENLIGAMGEQKPLKNFPVYHFFYPPQIAPLSMAVAVLPYGVAKWVSVALNSAMALVLGCLLAWVARQQSRAHAPLGRNFSTALAATLGIGAPFCAHIIWMGQTSLIACVSITTSYLLYRNGSKVVAGGLLGLASFKPQLAFLAGLWMLLEREWRLLAVAALTSLAMCAWPMVTDGIIGAPRAWMAAVQHHDQVLPNQLGWKHIVGLRNFLFVAGLPAPNLVPLGVLAALLVWWKRHTFTAFERFAVIMAATIVFTNAHDYDLIAILPLLVCLWLRVEDQPALWLPAAFTVLALMVPQRLVDELNVPILSQWRVVLVIAVAASIVAMAFRSSKIHRTASA
ncbi:MAG: glycosyltransferase family 87 protein [Candidatus Hydrogenedentota bacterium]